MDANIQNHKIDLIQWLTTLEDSSLIEKLIEFRNRETSDWWESISTEEQKSIEAGIADAENGKLKDQSEAKKIYGKWL